MYATALGSSLARSAFACTCPGSHGSPVALVESRRTSRTVCGPALPPRLPERQPGARLDGGGLVRRQAARGQAHVDGQHAPRGLGASSPSSPRQPPRPTASRAAQSEAVALPSTARTVSRPPRLWANVRGRCAWRAHRRRRLPRAERGDPGDRPEGHRPPRTRDRGLPRRLARPARERLRGAHRGVHSRHPAARRHHPRHLPHQPARARRRAGADPARTCARSTSTA